jgi:tyrosinase
MEHHLQRVLDDESFGLPYWDWSSDGELMSEQQKSAPLWSNDCMGGSGNPVITGPFAQGLWKINVREDPEGNIVRTDSSLRRNFAGQIDKLPNRTEVQTAVDRGSPNVTYDTDPWNAESISFRNELEGWLNTPPSKLHNAVHVWVGGDMFFGTSPNDPVFYLNHCNIDRIWSAWMKKYNNPEYLPRDTVSDELKGHRLNDLMHSLVEDNLFDPLYGGNAKPKDFIDVSTIYEYDTINL